MTNTHILIPIKDIEYKIKTLQVAQTRVYISQEIAYLRGKLSMLEEISDLGKQISLNEEDIEAKATAFGKTGVVSGKFGYKQALKDLKQLL